MLLSMTDVSRNRMRVWVSHVFAFRELLTPKERSASHISQITSKLTVLGINALQLIIMSHTGKYGRYLFTIASGRSGINYDQKCFKWFAGEVRWMWLLRYYLRWTQPCPCDRRLARMDSRWRFDWRQFYRTNYEKRCYYERIPWWYSSQVSIHVICYIVYDKTSHHAIGVCVLAHQDYTDKNIHRYMHADTQANRQIKSGWHVHEWTHEQDGKHTHVCAKHKHTASSHCDPMMKLSIAGAICNYVTSSLIS